MTSKQWISQVPVLSTAHLPKAVYDDWADKIASGDRAGSVYMHGMWVWVPTDPDADEDAPPELRAIFDWARARDYDYVRFDADGVEWTDLPLYEYTWEGR